MQSALPSGRKCEELCVSWLLAEAIPVLTMRTAAFAAEEILVVSISWSELGGKALENRRSCHQKAHWDRIAPRSFLLMPSLPPPKQFDRQKLSVQKTAPTLSSFWLRTRPAPSAPAVEKPADEGIPVTIAYDRLIENSGPAFYITFDNK